jgi:hypothetical protein
VIRCRNISTFNDLYGVAHATNRIEHPDTTPAADSKQELKMIRMPTASEPARAVELVPVASTHNLSVVMPGLVPGTHVFRAAKQGVGGRDEPGHDELGGST